MTVASWRFTAKCSLVFLGIALVIIFVLWFKLCWTGIVDAALDNVTNNRHKLEKTRADFVSASKKSEATLRAVLKRSSSDDPEVNKLAVSLADMEFFDSKLEAALRSLSDFEALLPSYRGAFSASRFAECSREMKIRTENFQLLCNEMGVLPQFSEQEMRSRANAIIRRLAP